MTAPSVQDTCAKRFFAQRGMLNGVKSITGLGLLVTVSTVVAYLVAGDHCSGPMCDFKFKFYPGGNVTAGSIAGTAGVSLGGLGLMALVFMLIKANCCVSRPADPYSDELIERQLAKAIYSLENESSDSRKKQVAEEFVINSLDLNNLNGVVHELTCLFAQVDDTRAYSQNVKRSVCLLIKNNLVAKIFAMKMDVLFNSHIPTSGNFSSRYHP